MGRDKATLAWGDPPQPLWQFQLQKLDALDPGENLISARSDQDFGTCKVVLDETPGAGPLPALAHCFEQARSAYLLPLAVDMAAMSTRFLGQLLAASGPRGLVYRDGPHFQPFPALYPRLLLPVIEECLAAGNDSLRQFIREAIARDLLAVADLSPAEALLFKSLNTPGDLPAE